MKSEDIDVVASFGRLSESGIVYPNPSISGVFQIDGEDVLRYAVYNTNGVLISKGNSQSLDLSKEPSGLYFLNVINAYGSATTRMIQK